MLFRSKQGVIGSSPIATIIYALSGVNCKSMSNNSLNLSLVGVDKVVIVKTLLWLNSCADTLGVKRQSGSDNRVTQGL